MPRPRFSRAARRNLPLVVILAILTVAVIYAGIHSLFQAPEQKTEDPPSAETTGGTKKGGKKVWEHHYKVL